MPNRPCTVFVYLLNFEWVLKCFSVNINYRLLGYWTINLMLLEHRLLDQRMRKTVELSDLESKTLSNCLALC
jgi:hypothetical protein